MSEKKLGRKFNVGDKVVFTEEAIKNGIFASVLRAGDTAVVKEVAVGQLGQYPIEVAVKELGGDSQYVESEYDGEVYEWFEHADDKKKRKKKKEKQRKYFRMGDFVALKDGVNPGELLGFGDIPLDAVGVVCGNGDEVSMEVHYGIGTAEYARVHPEALRLATKEERKALRKHKVANITHDDVEAEEVEESIPAEYDVKDGDIVEVTRYCGGHAAGSVVQVVEIDEKFYTAKYNTVAAQGFDGEVWYEEDVKLVYRKENDGDNA